MKMKHLKTILLALSLLLAGSYAAKADPITDISQLSNAKAYTVTTARGAWTLNSAGTDLASTLKTNGSATNDDASTDADAQLFAIYQSNGYYHVYSLKAGKFMALNATKLYQYPMMPLVFTSSGNASYPLRLSTFDQRNYANNNNGGQIKLDSWTSADDGNRLAIEEARDLTTEEQTAISNAFAASPLNSNKAFTVTANRGTWCANAAGTSLATTTTNAEPAEGYDQFAVMMFDNTLYLYNIGTKKFIKKDGSLKEGRGDAINIRYSGDDTRPYMFYFPDGPVYFNMQNGGGSYAMNDYSSPDDGNKQSIGQVSVDPYADASAEYNKTVVVTFNLMYEGTRVGTESVSQRLGVAPSVSSSLSKGFNCTYSESLIQSGTTTVTATVVLPFTVSPDYVGATWYNMYIRQDNRWVPYSDSEEPYSPYDATAEDKATKALQWAFIGNPFTTGIKVVNRAAGRGKSLTKDGNNAVMRDGDTYWDIFGRNGGILLREQGTTNNFINQAGGGDGKLQFWNSSYAKNDNGSTMWLVEAAVKTTNITYHVMYNGAEVASATATAVVDDPTPLTKIPDAIIRDYVTLTGDDTHNIVADDNIDLTATWDGPFEISADYASAHWYDMAIRSNWYVTSDNVDGDGALKTVEANALGLGEDAYQWAFIGNPYNLKLYNKGKGNSVAYAWTTNTNSSIPTFVDASTANSWWIRKSTSGIENSFMLTIPDYGYQVNQFGGAGGSLKIWADTRLYDPGSALRAFEVPTDYAAFVNDEITPNMGSGYFWLKESVKTAMGWDPNYTTSCTLQQYKDLHNAYAAIDKTDLSNYNLPETGYYRFKNTNYNKYMGLKAAVVYGNYTGDDVTNAATVVKLTQGTGENTGKYSIQVQGKYLQGLSQSANVPLADNAAWFSPAITTIGSGTFSVDGGQYTYIHCAGGGNVVGWTVDAGASQWALEDATSINVNISAAGYATLYVPFPVTVPTGVKAYAVGSLTGNLINLTEIETTIPAGTPVILEGEANTYTFAIANEVAAYAGSNELTGSFTEMAAPNGSYILQNQEGKVGFYEVDTEVATPRVPANRAYLPALGGDVKAFYLGGGEDAIKSVFEGVAAGEVYDLSGRKLSKLQRGVNIVTGKKVIVK